MDFTSNTLITAGTIYIGANLFIAWIASIIWAYRDMRSRSRDTIMQTAAAALVGAFTLPGLIIYLFLRPKETLTEAYERSLEEEALLQEIEEKPTCPGCGQRIQDNWQVCAYCHTRLKKVCYNCRNLLEITWDVCPHCTAVQAETKDIGHNISVQRTTASQPRRQATDPLEFVDDEDY
jgi:RNA polymerase subunit RPABC4/transcription elongation factor Spt4